MTDWTRRLTAFAATCAALLCVAPNALASPYSDAVVADGPAAYYRLNETMGTTMVSQVGSPATDGTYIAPFTLGAAGSDADALDKAVTFGSPDGGASIPFVPQNDFTLELWVKTTDPDFGSPGGQWYTGHALIDGEVGGSTSDLGLSHIAGRAAFGTGGPDITIHGTSKINDGVWHYIVATRTASTGALALWVDGVLEASNSGAALGARNATSNLTLARTHGSFGSTPGTFDEVAIYNKVLTASEIAARYALVPDLKPPSTSTQGAPSGLIDDSTPTFTLVSSEQSSTFECRVDSTDPGDFEACGTNHENTGSGTTTATYTAPTLGNGPHTIEVRAKDTAGNTDASPESVSFTVDASVAIWNLTNDFRTGADKANPNPDSHGLSNVWEFMETAGGFSPSSAASLDPDLLSRYLTFETAGCNTKESLWHNGSSSLRKYTGPTANCGNAQFVEGKMITHPGQQGQAAVAAWHSPVTGSVAITGRIDDRDPSCGNGVDWVIQRNRDKIASGAIGNGNTGQAFADGTDGATLADVSVAAGDTIYLMIGWAGEFSCDLTELDYTITAQDADRDYVSDDADADSGHTDSDGDGLADTSDACPNSPSANPNGCATVPEWDLNDDFKLSPDHSNTSSDTWQYMRSGASLDRDPANFSLLPSYSGAHCSGAVHGWGLESTGPYVLKHPGLRLIGCGTAVFPAKKVAMDGSTTGRYAIAAWKSPFKGAIAITGGVSDNDPNCGDGTDWFIDRDPPEGPRVTLASGHLNNGVRAKQSFADGTGGGTLGNVPVENGEFVYLLIGDAEGSCDMTLTDLHIRQVSVFSDTTAPETSTQGAPSGTIGDPTPSFTLESTEPNSTFECRIDSTDEDDFDPCGTNLQNASGKTTASYTAPTLGHGAHKIEIRAKDAAGNTDAMPATVMFAVDAVPPETTTEGSPDGNTTGDTTPTFTLESGEPSSTFECRIDSTDEDDYEPCGTGHQNVSGMTFASYTVDPALAEGSHTIHIRATDAVGNTDLTPVAVTFTVDASAAPVSILDGPTGRTRDTQPTFRLRATEINSTFECRIDSTQEDAYAPCGTGHQNVGTATEASYQVPSPLPNGTHILTVRAKDAFGNKSDPVSRSFTIDTVRPDTTIMKNVVPFPPPPFTRQTKPSFYVSSTEWSSTFLCRVDAGARGPCAANHKNMTLRGTRALYTRKSALANGPHQIAVWAVDQAGNVDSSPAIVKFTVDTIAPKITELGVRKKLNSKGRLHFAFEADDPNAQFECALGDPKATVDNLPFVPCRAPHKPTDKPKPERKYVFAVRALDKAGRGPVRNMIIIVNEKGKVTVQK